MTERRELPRALRDAGLLARRRFLQQCVFGLGALFAGGGASSLARAAAAPGDRLAGLRPPGFGAAKNLCNHATVAQGLDSETKALQRSPHLVLLNVEWCV